MATYATKGDRLENRTIRTQSIKNPVSTLNSSSTSDGRGLSPGLWSTCPVELLKANPQYGTFMLDDFADGGIVIANNVVTAAASATGTVGKWTGCTAATSPTVSTLATEVKGIVKLATSDDNQDAIICYPSTGHTAGPYKFSSGTRLWMEARVSILNITTNKHQVFFGFAEEGLVATTTLLAISEAGLADKDYVGFLKTFAATAGLAAVWNTASGGSSPVTVDAAAATLEADTFTKIGIYCDGTTVRFYQDGIQTASDLIADTDFPDGEEMAFYIAVMDGPGAEDMSISVDWVALAQAYSLNDPVVA